MYPTGGMCIRCRYMYHEPMTTFSDAVTTRGSWHPAVPFRRSERRLAGSAQPETLALSSTWFRLHLVRLGGRIRIDAP